MKTNYQGGGQQAGVINYELLSDGIILEFRGGKYRYVYDAVSPGPERVAAMQRLALEGRGLTTYVSRRVHNQYAARLPLKPEQLSPDARFAPCVGVDSTAPAYRQRPRKPPNPPK